ncbi:hypothetical protein HMI56_004187 [Coelomomyces lativittatus]|nr:hypothetical protein HMI56_004187 [Coelomomyces lativittatus]
MAPEVMKRTAYDFRADIWSLGITTFEIATGGPPHASKDPMKALFISEFKDIQLPESFSPLMKEFMTLCLHEDPKFRPAADELLKFKWIKNAPKGTEILLDLVIRHTEWQLSQAESSSCKTALSDDDLMLERHADDWNFDTVQSIQIQNQTSPTNYTNVKHEKFSEESSTSMIAPLPSTLPSRKGHRRNKTSIIKTLEASPTKTDAPQIPVLSISPEDTKAPILTDHIPRKNSEFSFLYDTALNQVFSTVPRQSKMESHFSQGSKILKELKTSPSLPFIIDTSILTKKSDKSLNRKSSLREENPTPLKPTFFSKSRAMDSRIYKPIKLINSALKKEQLTPSRPRASTAPEMYRQGDSRNTVSRISYLLNFHSRRKSSLLSTSNDPGPSLSDDTTSHLSAETSTSLTNSRRSNSVLSFFHKSKSEASDSLDRQPAHSLDRLSTSFMFSTEGTHSLKEPPKKKEWCSSVFYNEVVNQTSSTSAFIPTEPMPITSIQVQSLGQLNCPAMVERPDMFLESEATSDLQTHQMESQFNELCEACWYWLDLSEQHMQRISTLERKA